MNRSNRKNQLSSAEIIAYPLRETISQYMMFHVTNGHSKETIRYYTCHLGQIADWLEQNGIEDIESITVQDLRAYFAQYQESHTRNGTNVIYRAVKAFMRWAWDEYDLESKNPISKIRIGADPITPIEGVNPKDIDKLFAAAEQGDYPERDCALLAILLDTGIRKSSVANILKEDVNLTSGSIYIRHTKNHRPMTVYLGSIAKKHIRKYWQTLDGLPGDFAFFITEYDTPLSIDGIREVLRRICKRAGLPEYSAHDFRRYFALQAYRNGADIYAVAQLLGHTGIEVTKRYLATDENDRRLLHACVSPLDHKKK